MFRKSKKAGLEIEKCFLRKTGLLLVCFLACISIGIPVMGTELRTKSYPMPFHVDFIYYLPTSLYIKCDVKEYNMPFPDFSSKESGTRESRFQELVLAMRNNDVEKCLNMTFRKSGMNEQDTNRHNAKARQWASACHSRYFKVAVINKLK